MTERRGGSTLPPIAGSVSHEKLCVAPDAEYDPRFDPRTFHGNALVTLRSDRVLDRMVRKFVRRSYVPTGVQGLHGVHNNNPAQTPAEVTAPESHGVASPHSTIASTAPYSSQPDTDNYTIQSHDLTSPNFTITAPTPYTPLQYIDGMATDLSCLSPIPVVDMRRKPSNRNWQADSLYLGSARALSETSRDSFYGMESKDKKSIQYDKSTTTSLSSLEARSLSDLVKKRFTGVHTKQTVMGDSVVPEKQVKSELLSVIRVYGNAERSAQMTAKRAMTKPNSLKSIPKETTILVTDSGDDGNTAEHERFVSTSSSKSNLNGHDEDNHSTRSGTQTPLEDITPRDVHVGTTIRQMGAVTHSDTSRLLRGVLSEEYGNTLAMDSPRPFPDEVSSTPNNESTTVERRNVPISTNSSINPLDDLSSTTPNELEKRQLQALELVRNRSSIHSMIESTRVSQLIHPEESYAVRWSQMKKQRDELRHAEEQRQKNKEISHLMRRLVITSEKSETRRQIDATRRNSHAYQYRRQIVEKIHADRQLARELRDQRLEAKKENVKSLRSCIETNLALSRSILECDREMLSSSRALSTSHLDTFSLDENSSTLLDIPTSLNESISSAKSMLSYQNAREELRSFQTSEISRRIKNRAKKQRTARIQAALAKSTPVSSIVLDGSVYFEDDSDEY